ncbi:MAG: hypothetical protein K2W82_11205 [Candidatus Obscuribacterales bacterium]|nr:hypothetical protein [Candidatus Obscuribacterales bacterium]
MQREMFALYFVLIALGLFGSGILGFFCRKAIGAPLFNSAGKWFLLPAQLVLILVLMIAFIILQMQAVVFLFMCLFSFVCALMFADICPVIDERPNDRRPLM